MHRAFHGRWTPKAQVQVRQDGFIFVVYEILSNAQLSQIPKLFLVNAKSPKGNRWQRVSSQQLARDITSPISLWMRVASCEGQSRVWTLIALRLQCCILCQVCFPAGSRRADVRWCWDYDCPCHSKFLLQVLLFPKEGYSPSTLPI